MTTVIAGLIGFLLIAAIMAVGVLLGGSPLKGSCGGKGGPECICDEFEQRKCAAKNKLVGAKAANPWSSFDK